MSTDTSTTPEATAGNETSEKPVYAKGTWQEQMQRSASLLDRSAKARKTASNLLWTGAQEAITEWLPGGDSDVSGERLYNEVKDILGASRKGDANKIKTVAVAVKDHGLVLSVWPNLSKAYGEAVRLTKTVAAQAEEDDAAEVAIASISAPSTTSTVDGAAAILLSKGVDGAVVAILDALGKDNEGAHRAFMRAVSTEINARVQAKKPKPAPKTPAAPKTGATVAKKAAPKKAAAKKTTKAKPVAKKAAAPNAAPVAEKPVEDMFPDESGEQAETTTVETPAVPVAQKKGAPVVIKR